MKRDLKGLIRYTSLQSNTGKRVLQEYGVTDTYLASLVFIDEGKVYLKSTAALRICKHLNGLWPILYIFIIVPPFIRNTVYDVIARYRYRLFGKNEQCVIPGPEQRALFLEDEL